jgi:hypothetical protein
MRMPRLAVLGAVCLLGACSQMPVDSSDQKEGLHTLEAPDFVARAMAVAMADEGVRTAVRNHMRASPVSEHKLQLQEYVAGPLGETLLAAIDRSGIGRIDFLNNLSALPPIQFYVPARQQRLSWTGTAQILVSPNLGDGSPGFGYAPTGARVTLRLTGGAVPGEAFFVLQREEPSHKRVRSQGNAAGNVIQDPDDHDFGGARIYRDGAGNVVRTEEFADLRPVFLDCGPEAFYCDVGSGGGGGGPPAGLYLTRLVNHGVCDNVCIFETLEFEFRSQSQFNPEWVISTQLTGIGSGEYNLNMYISSYRPVGQWVDAGVWETDSWPNGDDVFVCHWNLTGCPTGLPRVQVAPSGSIIFGLCETIANGCANSPYDLQVTFKDGPG